jgi:DNA mismatch repair protein MutS
MSALVEQYKAIKAKYPDAILLFRVGDFYESFGEDAKIVSKQLGLILTNSSCKELKAAASLPFHALDIHLKTLVKAGYRVAICEQLEDPKTARGIVKRGVTNCFKPGL